jgi:uncharacterized protein
MATDLTNLAGSDGSFDKELEPGELGLADENIEFSGPVHVNGEIRREASAIAISGNIYADASINCTRCAAAVEHKLSIPFDVRYTAAAEADEAAESSEVDPAELDAAVIPESGLGLEELVREQILLSLPMQFFCRPDCKGICTICGGNRNLIDCKCMENEIDPRWAALKNLK